MTAAVRHAEHVEQVFGDLIGEFRSVFADLAFVIFTSAISLAAGWLDGRVDRRILVPGTMIAAIVPLVAVLHLPPGGVLGHGVALTLAYLALVPGALLALRVLHQHHGRMR